MSMFLFHSIRLAPRVLRLADLLWAVCLLSALFAWVAFGDRAFGRGNDTRANKIRIYRHLWNSLENVYRDLQDGSASAAALRTHWREGYRFFLRNGRVIEPGDRLVFREYIITLQDLRSANGPDEVGAWEASSPSLSSSAANRAKRMYEATQLRSVVWQRVSHILPSA